MWVDWTEQSAVKREYVQVIAFAREYEIGTSFINFF